MASINGDTSASSTATPNKMFSLCVVGDALQHNELLMKSAEKFGLPVIYSSDGLELLNQVADFTIIYVLDAFEGDVFKSLQKAGQRIVGPTTVIKYAKENKSLPNIIRPLYTSSMKHLSITFSGFKLREEITKLAAMVHHMGGSIRKEYNLRKTTHLVATSAAIYGEKYQYALCMRIPIMTADWILETWARRNDVNCCATDEELMQYRLLPFMGCYMAFVGHQKEEEEHMIDISIKNGGVIVKPNDPSCSHILVEDGCEIKRSDYSDRVHLVKTEWFWASIQMEAKAQESLYSFEKVSNQSLSSSVHIVPTRGNKRKRLESVAHQLAMEGLKESDLFNLSPSTLKKKSDVAKLSISASFLDATFSPEKSLDPDITITDLEKQMKSPPHLDMRTFSPRQQVCFELFQTESNYVGILHTIMTVFKEPLENSDQVGGSLLAPAEIKIIFGNLPPIYEIHQNIRRELAEIMHSWRDDHGIGSVILNHSQELMKSYPPFVNFFEKTKEILASCDANKPRFHAFLKRCQSRPECGRQTLQELLIRPVQRLPSIILLLNDILKHTPKANTDYQALENAIKALKNVLMHINEDKRKTEGQMEMFDIVNDIENCPPNLLSSQRKLVSRTDMQEATDILGRKGGQITMFLFSDVLEICKKRTKSTNTLKSPGIVGLASSSLKSQTKPYKHLEMIQLSHIKRIVDVLETNEHKNVFAIVSWSSIEVKELIHAFTLCEGICKKEFLRTLSRQVGNSICKADAESTLLTELEPHQLDLQSSENSGNAITKALKKTQSKLGRALSMRRTPTKRGLSRAVSTIFSPLSNRTNSSNSISTLRLSSVTNLTRLPNLLPEALLPLNSHYNQWLNATKSKPTHESNSRSLCRLRIASHHHPSSGKS